MPVPDGIHGPAAAACVAWAALRVWCAGAFACGCDRAASAAVLRCCATRAAETPTGWRPPAATDATAPLVVSEVPETPNVRAPIAPTTASAATRADTVSAKGRRRRACWWLGRGTRRR